MREIKFRAWLKEKKIMFEVSEINFIFNRVEYVVNKIKNLVYTQSDKLEKFILMQYTGIKDKNGKEIYEGDIIQRIDYKFKIIWDETRFIGIGVSHVTGENLLCCINSFDKFGKNYVEVIGNIYENPELLGDDE